MSFDKVLRDDGSPPDVVLDKVWVSRYYKHSKWQIHGILPKGDRALEIEIKGIGNYVSHFLYCFWCKKFKQNGS